MSSTNTASTRICPVCDARNSNISLFCAECGAALNLPAEGDTSAYEPMSSNLDDAQATAAFTPAASTSKTSVPTISEPATTVAPFPTTWEAPATAKATDAVWTPADTAMQPVPTPTEPDLGMRGFWLGLIALLLVLAVFFTWSWASILDASTRESIRDFFGFIG